MDEPETIARVGLAGWFGESEPNWAAVPVLGAIGDELYLIEIDADNRARSLRDLVDGYDVADRSLGIEAVFFGHAGAVFASSLDFLAGWPRGRGEVPTEVFVDDRHKAAFSCADDDIVVSVRHALRLGDAPPKRRFRFRPDTYEGAMSQLAAESRRLRDDLIAVAQERAPQKVEALRQVCKLWPA